MSMTALAIFDKDGYPTEELLDLICNWPHEEGFLPLMELVRDAWSYQEWGWQEQDGEESGRPVRRFQISTAGWSGNEDLISALEENEMFWFFCWQSYLRGGHYVFEVPLGPPVG